MSRPSRLARASHVWHIPLGTISSWWRSAHMALPVITQLDHQKCRKAYRQVVTLVSFNETCNYNSRCLVILFSPSNLGTSIYVCCLQVKRDLSVSLAGPGGGLRSLGVPGGAGGLYGGRVVGVTAVVALALIFPDRGETVPPLFQKVICYIDTPVQSILLSDFLRSFTCDRFFANGANECASLEIPPAVALPLTPLVWIHRFCHLRTVCVLSHSSFELVHGLNGMDQRAISDDRSVPLNELIWFMASEKPLCVPSLIVSTDLSNPVNRFDGEGSPLTLTTVPTASGLSYATREAQPIRSQIFRYGKGVSRGVEIGRRYETVHRIPASTLPTTSPCSVQGGVWFDLFFLVAVGERQTSIKTHFTSSFWEVEAHLFFRIISNSVRSVSLIARIPV